MPYFRQILVYGNLYAPQSELDLVGLFYIISLVIGLVMTIASVVFERRGLPEFKHMGALFGGTTFVGLVGLLYGAM